MPTGHSLAGAQRETALVGNEGVPAVLALRGCAFWRQGAGDRATRRPAVCQPPLALRLPPSYLKGRADTGKSALSALEGALAYLNPSRNEREEEGYQESHTDGTRDLQKVLMTTEV